MEQNAEELEIRNIAESLHDRYVEQLTEDGSSLPVYWSDLTDGLKSKRIELVRSIINGTCTDRSSMAEFYKKTLKGKLMFHLEEKFLGSVWVDVETNLPLIPHPDTGLPVVELTEKKLTVTCAGSGFEATEHGVWTYRSDAVAAFKRIIIKWNNHVESSYDGKDSSGEQHPTEPLQDVHG